MVTVILPITMSLQSHFDSIGTKGSRFWLSLINLLQRWIRKMRSVKSGGGTRDNCVVVSGYRMIWLSLLRNSEKTPAMICILARGQKLFSHDIQSFPGPPWPYAMIKLHRNSQLIVVVFCLRERLAKRPTAQRGSSLRQGRSLLIHRCCFGSRRS